MLTPFHYAFPVRDLAATREFYVDVLGCGEGRSSEEWIDFDLYGHQVVAHLAPRTSTEATPTNRVDQHDVPIPHFGVVLEWQAWQALADRLRSRELEFLIEPTIRFEGQVGEQATMFFSDPSGNALEFKSFKDPARLFAAE
jgi:hypothetical protein